MDKFKTFSTAIFAMVFWALSFVWVKVAYQSFVPLSLVCFRLLGASILLIALGTLFKRLQAIKRGDFKYFLLLAFFEPFLYFMGESYGMKNVSSTLGAVIISTIPLFAPIAGWYFAKERITANNIIGILISLAGVFFIVYDFGDGLEASLIGVSLMLVAVFAAIFYTVMLRKLSHHYTGISIVTYQSIIGLIYFLPFFFVFEFNKIAFNGFTKESIQAAIELTMFASVFAFLFFTYSVKRIGITKANAFVNLIPAITYIFAIFILDEALEAKKIIGIVIVIGGLFVCQVKSKRNSPAMLVEK